MNSLQRGDPNQGPVADDGVVISGYLAKTGKTLGLLVRRWYVLTSYGVFRCYGDKKAKEWKSDVVMRTSHVTIRPADGKEPTKLVITVDSEPTILWSEDKDPDTKKWFEALKRFDSSSMPPSIHPGSLIDIAHSPGPIAEKALSAHASPVNANSTHAIQRAVELYNTPVKSNRYTKFLVALGISASSPLAWIAEHIARPPLPPDWEKLKDEKKRTYYANTSLNQSSWEHPLLFYYPWLCRVFSRMLPLDTSTRVPVAPHEIIDFLINESHLLAELNLEAECLPMHDIKSLHRRVSCDPVFYYTWLFTPKHAHARQPHLSLSDERPWDPELVRSVAEYYGIDLAVEPHLIWLPKLALVAPLPPFWTSSEDENGDTLFYCIVSSYCTQGHPVDRYVTLLLQQSRLNTSLENHCPAVRAGWFDIINADGNRVWYNMATSESSAQLPSGWDDVHERRLQASWNLDIETLILSLCHIRQQQGLQPEWEPSHPVNAHTASAQAAAAHPVATSEAVSPGDVPLALEDSFAGPSANDEIMQPVLNSVFSPGDEAPDDGSISGSEDFDNDGADKFELPQASDGGELATSQRRMLFECVDISTQTSPVVFQPPEVESTSYFVDGFSMSGAVRSGSHPIHPVHHFGVQCSLRPESKDASCFTSFSPDSAPSHTSQMAGEVQDVSSTPPPHSAQLQDVIAHQLKVNLSAI
jgi:hypothetical protein